MFKYAVKSIIIIFCFMLTALNVAAESVVDEAVMDDVVANEMAATDSVTPEALAKEALDEAWLALTKKSYSEKNKAIKTIVKHSSPYAYDVLSTMLDGQLYYSKLNKTLYILQEVEEVYEFKSLFVDDVIKQDDKNGYKKVKINNQLRNLIRQNIASMQIKNEDAEVRLKAINALLKKPDEDAAALVLSVIDSERNDKVKSAMQTLLAVTDLQSNDEITQSKAIATLAASLNPTALNALSNYQPDDKALKKQSEKAISEIENSRARYAKIETIFFGLSLGSVLALAAIGLAITFGVMGVINMAHGELMMIGAYTTYVVQQLMPNNIGLSIIVAIPAAFIVAGLVGIGIERTVIRHLYGRPLETLLATFGVSLVLQQTVRSIFSPLNRSVETPQWMSGAWQFNEILAFTWNRFYIIIFCLMVFAVLIFVMKKTSLGLQVRAVSQNRTMARAMGVKSEWVDALTFGLGSGIAGLAGVALSLLTNVGPNLGQAYIIDSFMVVVFGGVGNLWGTLIAGMSLGVINKILEPWAGAVLAKILVLIFIILFIQKRPKGLFPQQGRAVED
ncbi:Urea ABC transporter, permease protein UrtB [hydrothermal vent metagenome]|uniref:Urea ABC transporter, permease protein UrtB n=1 Tax=hydrothermal vent metagenome TaxID=652676 RepID=A0A3B0W669_9ZZZZ